jgi:GNAT superfamily N-acetyltransferase
VPLLPGEERIEEDGYTLWLGRDPAWNCVQRIRLGDVDAAVAEVRAALRERGRGPSQWEFGPSATPADLEQQLLALGFVPDVEPLQWMMVLTHEPPAVDGVEARPVRSAAELAEAFDVMHRAFGGGASRTDADAAWERRDPSLRETFVALVDGAIVGAATASFADAGVQLNAGAVLPESRGRGVYRALVAARWHAGQERGLGAAVTQAGAMSREILLRLGFEACGEIRSYVDAVGNDP